MDPTIAESHMGPNLMITAGPRQVITPTCGMRSNELINLWVKDVDFDRGTVFIRCGKGSKDRYVPIGERALFWLQLYLEPFDRNSWVRLIPITSLSRRSALPSVGTGSVARYEPA